MSPVSPQRMEWPQESLHPEPQGCICMVAGMGTGEEAGSDAPVLSLQGNPGWEGRPSQGTLKKSY
jgi:hypothetical protein